MLLSLPTAACSGTNAGVTAATTSTMRPVLVLLSAGVLAAVGCGSRGTATYSDAQAAAWEMARRARQDSIAAIYQARFGLSYGRGRGDTASVMPLSGEQQAAVYRLVARSFFSARSGGADTATGRVRADARPWVEIHRLPHEGGYVRPEAIGDSVVHALLDSQQFEGVCGAAPWPACPPAGAPARFTFSAIYRIEPGVLRVFVVRRTTYAHEKMFRVEQRGSGWVVTEDLSVMIT